MKSKNQHKKNQGFTLVEIVVVMGLFAMIFSTLMAAMTLSLHSAAQNQNRATAGNLAKEGIEVLRRERAIIGWSAFREKLDEDLDDGNDTYCFNSTISLGNFVHDIGVGPCANYGLSRNDLPVDYKREIKIERIAVDSYSVKVKVEWWRTETRTTSVEVSSRFAPF